MVGHKIVDHQSRDAAEPATGMFVEFGHDWRIELPAQQRDGLTAGSTRQDEEPALRHFPEFAPSGRDEALYALMSGGEAVIVDQVLPDRLGIASCGEFARDPKKTVQRTGLG
jgi:hypothetical protein